VPFTEYEDGSLNLEDCTRHLERRHVLVFIEVTEELLIPFDYPLTLTFGTRTPLTTGIFAKLVTETAFTLFAPSFEGSGGGLASGFDDPLV
jgi:hypothetical protein